MNCTKCGKEIPDGENKLCEECKNSLLTDLGNEEDCYNYIFNCSNNSYCFGIYNWYAK